MSLPRLRSWRRPLIACVLFFALGASAAQAQSARGGADAACSACNPQQVQGTDLNGDGAADVLADFAEKVVWYDGRDIAGTQQAADQQSAGEQSAATPKRVTCGVRPYIDAVPRTDRLSVIYLTSN